MKKEIIKSLEKVMTICGVDSPSIKLDYPENTKHGDFSTNIALMNAKKLGMPSKDLAEKIVIEFKKNMPDFISEVSIAGPGFINFFIKDKNIAEEVRGLASRRGLSKPRGEASKKVLVEYTDPNPFKVIHIGHLMSNAIGESISRLLEFSGIEVKRANWQGDIGPHVAKAMWGAQHLEREKDEKPALFWGRAYAFGAEAYETNAENKKEIDIINKKIYDRSDKEINELYDRGRKECLEAFEETYKRLDTKFDNYFFESIEGKGGETIVKEFLDKGVFEKSEGAIIFKGEKYGLHTRVFITSQGLPTYETKELGLNKEKFAKYPDLSESIIITANEQSDYFKVLLKVMDLVYPEIAKKTKHISHGMLRFASGKMSSRKGNVIAADRLIDEIIELVKSKIVDREFTDKEADEVSDIIAIGAIKYTILRQSIGSDIIFDSASSISFEGDSGPYLQYSAVRANSILEKAGDLTIEQFNNSTIKKQKPVLPEKVGTLEKLIIRFSDIVERAKDEYAPQLVANYLVNLAGAFNSFYASQIIVNKDDKLSPYYVALTKTFRDTMENGLWILGIKVPEKM